MKASLLLLHFLLLGLPWAPGHASARENITVKVLSLMYNLNGSTMSRINAVNAGFNASLFAWNWTVFPGVNIEVVRPPSYDTPPDVYLGNYVKDPENKKGLLVVLGPMGETNVFRSYRTLYENNIVSFAPLTETGEFHTFLPNIYFLRPGPDAELITLIRYAVNYMRVLRLGFMYFEGALGGSNRYERAVALLSQMGHQFCCVFTLQNHNGQRVSNKKLEEAWEKFSEGLPQAVIMFAKVKDDTKQFLEKLVSDPRTRGIYVLAPSLMQSSLVDTWREVLEATNVSFVPSQVMQTTTNPLDSAMHFEAIRRFRLEMHNYLISHENWSSLGSADHFSTSDLDGELMVYGWLAGEVLMRALRSNAWLDDRKAFLQSLYEQRRYLVSDIVIGDYGGDCSESAASRTAVCHCNRGGKTVYMKEIVEGYRSRYLPGGTVTLDPSTCGTSTFTMKPSLGGLVLNMRDDSRMWETSRRFFAGALASSSALKIGELNRFVLLQINSSTDKAVKDLGEYQGTRIINAVFGVAIEEMLSVPGVIFIDPLLISPRLNKFRANVIHISPTLEQQLFVLSDFLSASKQGKVRAVIRSGEAHNISRALMRTLLTFDLNLSSTVLLEDDSPIVEHIPTDGDLFLLGLRSADVAAVFEHLSNHRRLRVFVPFVEVLVLYDLFVGAFNNSEASKRFVFASSLPHWNDENPTLKAVRDFQSAAISENDRTPLSLLGFTIGRLMRRNLMRMDKVSPSLVADVFFKEASITVDGIRYGVFDKEDCIIKGVPVAMNCISNFGATNISVWSMARVLNSSVPVLREAMTPSMIYSNPNIHALTPGVLAGILSGSFIALLLLTLLGVALCCMCRSSRDNDNAPKEPSDPVTLIFTDIESSTALWAAHPERMPDAVAAHHRIVRSLISSYNCYEVKTVGDSFMIACNSASAAVRLARGLQQCFLDYDWGTNVFDMSYRNFEEERASSDESYTPKTARLDPEVYCKLWNGLRVRIGIHTGLCDIRHDEVTKGYDYYGQTPNMAARTESVTNGGQVLLTHAAYYSLSAAERTELDVKAMGPVSLRGVPEPVKMYQLNTVPGRSFAALRLDREADYLNDDTSVSNLSGSDHSSSIAELSESSQVIVGSLNALLGTFPAAQRQKALMPFCERWRVSLPRKSSAVWDNDYCQEVVKRIAAKVGHVVDYCAASGTEHSASTLTSASVIVISQPRAQP
uniref:adenylate cyclase n=1 Tax=Trypanosoma congolense (strain IL3000) TaxID=1068625 RepID=G0UVN1_TRYCI|nr:unnamed protein product [Trypanosoma congolense IL3000]